MEEQVADEPLIQDDASDPFGAPPWQAGQEWANALTHGLAALGTIAVAIPLLAATQTTGMMIACAAYMTSVFGTFTCSTLSHLVRPSPLLIQLRSWDQALIYTMIAGTYTPLIYRFADDTIRPWLLAAVWIAAGYGFLGKVALKHRVNSISTVTYLALGWLPAIPLYGRVPAAVVMWIFLGGILYTVGVAFLVNDHKLRYMHMVWHLFVILAALTHFWAIYGHVVTV